MLQILILKPARVIDGTGAQPRENCAVVVDGPELDSLVAFDELPAETDARVLELAGCSLLPGLIDLHIHLGYIYREPNSDSFDPAMTAYVALKNAREALESGVTTVRDAGSPHGAAIALSRARKNGYIKAPRCFASGQPIAMTGGHGAAQRDMVVEVNGPFAVRGAVREQLKKGADFIKLMGNEGQRLEYTVEEIRAAVDEAHRLDCRIAVHASSTPAIERAVAAGADTIEHGSYMSRALAAELVEKDITWVPTIVTYRNIARRAQKLSENPDQIATQFDRRLSENADTWADYWEAYQANFPVGLEEGVHMATGTDIILPNAPISPVAEEAAVMVELGMEPLHAIRAATATGARALGMGDTLGTLEPGKKADLLAVSGNPAETIEELRNVELVAVDGELLVNRAEL